MVIMTVYDVLDACSSVSSDVQVNSMMEMQSSSFVLDWLQNNALTLPLTVAQLT